MSNSFLFIPHSCQLFSDWFYYIKVDSKLKEETRSKDISLSNGFKLKASTSKTSCLESFSGFISISSISQLLFGYKKEIS